VFIGMVLNCPQELMQIVSENWAGPRIFANGRQEGAPRREYTSEGIIGTMQWHVCAYSEFHYQTPHSAGAGPVLLGIPWVEIPCQPMATAPTSQEMTAADVLLRFGILAIMHLT